MTSASLLNPTHNGRVSADERQDPSDAPGDPGLDAFEALVDAALADLPEAFRSQLDSVAIVIEDEATPEELARAHAAALLGLYTGVPRTAYGAGGSMVPSRITIYRRAHERQFGTGPMLAAGVARTVRHEIAHHLGISDARLDELWAPVQDAGESRR